jgi:hypothetical protein
MSSKPEAFSEQELTLRHAYLAKFRHAHHRRVFKKAVACLERLGYPDAWKSIEGDAETLGSPAGLRRLAAETAASANKALACVELEDMREADRIVDGYDKALEDRLQIVPAPE